MDKKNIILHIIVGLSFMLIGCTSNNVNLSENVESADASKNIVEKIADTDIESVGENEDNEQPDEVEDKTIPTAYIPVLNEIYNLIADYDDENYADSPYGLIGILEVTDPDDNPEEALASIGYGLKDINGDGLEELFISDGNNIFGLYTEKDNEAVQVTEGWARNRNYLLSDNDIYYEGSGGAAYTIFGIYRLNNGATELEAIDVYFSDYIGEGQQEIGWFYESDDVKDSILTAMTSDDIVQLRDEYRAKRVPLDLTYFVNYIPSE